MAGQPGWADVTSFGAVSDRAASSQRRADNTRGIQKAVDSFKAAGLSGGVVYFPPGTYQIDRTIEFDTGVTFQGANVAASAVESNHETEAVFGKRGLPSDLTRHFHVYFRDLYIRGTWTKGTSNTNKSIGIDFTNVSQCGLNTVKIEYVSVGVLVEGKSESIAALKGAHYVDLYSPLISTCYIGLKCHGHNQTDPGVDPGGGSANETHVFGGRIADVVTGIELMDVNNFSAYSTAIEGFGIGVDVRDRFTSSGGFLDPVIATKLIACRFEGGTKGIRVAKNADRTFICGAYFGGTSEDIDNQSSTTKVLP